MRKTFILGLLFVFVFSGCGDIPSQTMPITETTPVPITAALCGGDNMQTLPGKFAAENSKDNNTPSLLVDIQAGVLQSDQTTQANWQANTGESAVDYAAIPGDVILARSACAWTQKASGASGRMNHAAAVNNGKMYISGGYNGGALSDFWEYNIASNSWTQKTGPGFARMDHTIVAYQAGGTSGRIYLFGGHNNGGTYYAELWEYDIAGNSWTQKTSMPATARATHTAVLHDGKMYIFGGITSGGIFPKETWEYDIATDTWTQKASNASVANARYYGALYNATLFVVPLNNAATDVWAYSVTANTWTSLAALPTWRAGQSIVASAGKLFMFAGIYPTNTYTNHLFEYDIATDIWTQLSPTGGPPAGRQFPTAVVYQGKMYTFGGNSPGPTYYSDVWETPVGYAASGYIYTQDMDITTAPTVNGEWTLEDTAPAGASIAYTAWASDTGAFAGEETSLGTIVDGGVISTLKRYYRVKADLATTDGEVTPQLQRIKAAFTSFDTYADNGSLGYEPSVLDVSALTTMVDFFDKSTISQVTLTMGLTPVVSNWLSTAYPRNKVVKIKAGYVASTWTRDDYIDYFTGQVEDWRVNDGKVSLVVRDYSKSWKTPVPAKWESAADNVTWTVQHPVDVMLDILRNYVNVRDSQLVTSSFSTVKTALSGWAVTRTITSNPVEAETLLQELRMLTSTYFIPQADGRITLKRYDSTEASVLALTDDNFKDVTYDGNAAAMCNQYHTYFNSVSNGDNASDFTDFRAAIDAASQTNWNELRLKDFKDKWTRTAQVAQVQDRETKIITRFANPPAIISGTIHRSHIAAEVGDMFSVTTVHAPAPITAAKYQLINKNLDYAKDTIKIKLLRA